MFLSAPPDTPAQYYRWAGALLAQLHPLTTMSETGEPLPRDVRSERGVDYCDVFKQWEQVDPDKNPGITPGTMIALIRAAAVTPALAKAQKWGVSISQDVNGVQHVPKCNPATIPKDNSWTGEAGDALDDVVRGTAQFLQVAGKLMPWMLAFMVLSQVTSLTSMLTGGRRR